MEEFYRRIQEGQVPRSSQPPIGEVLDAYARFVPNDTWNVTLGQMRVPFTIDAHRSPHQQYFANRSFIAKQVGNVRDVGATGAFSLKEGLPLKLEGGLFNGSGLTNQKEWHISSSLSLHIFSAMFSL